jgi:hypothetical protein
MSRKDNDALMPDNTLPGGSFPFFKNYVESKLFTIEQCAFFGEALDHGATAEAADECDAGFFPCSDEKLAIWSRKKISKLLRFFVAGGFMTIKTKDGERWLRINLETVREAQNRKLGWR